MYREHTSYYVYWYESTDEGEIYQEYGDFWTFDEAEKWMNNNLDSSIKFAAVGIR